MRLANEERQAISDAIRHADANAQTYLYGSRADDSAHGGDIDLLVLSREIDLKAKLEILARLHRQLGERRIDIAVYPDTTRPFARLAIKTGVPL